MIKPIKRNEDLKTYITRLQNEYEPQIIEDVYNALNRLDFETTYNIHFYIFKTIKPKTYFKNMLTLKKARYFNDTLRCYDSKIDYIGYTLLQQIFEPQHTKIKLPDYTIKEMFYNEMMLLLNTNKTIKNN